MENLSKLGLNIINSNKNNFKELDINTLEKLDIRSSDPILTCSINANQTHYVTKINNIVSLDDTSSKYDLLTFRNEFNYNRQFIDFIFLKCNSVDTTVLVLGFGLGGISLELSLNDKVKYIDCIDNNICMFKLYNTLISEKPQKLHYYLIDAKKYIIHTSKTYDIIIDDVFHFSDKIFYDFELAARKLNNNGWLLINMYDYSNYLKYEKNLKKIFNRIIVDTTQNICVFCQKTKYAPR